VQTNAKIHDADRFKFDSDQFFVKSADEMSRLFPDSPGVLSRTMEIAERCSFKLHPVDDPFPEFAVPDGHTIDSYFEQVCREGLKKRLETSVRQLEIRGVRRSTPEQYHARLDYEIGIITQMKYSGYFLIVWDFIKYARDNGIPVGPGRGSATSRWLTRWRSPTSILCRTSCCSSASLIPNASPCLTLTWTSARTAAAK
jgi:DNA polymerase-3 subunit alpha